jgi:hypothetical protein
LTGATTGNVDESISWLEHKPCHIDVYGFVRRGITGIKGVVVFKTEFDLPPPGRVYKVLCRPGR